MAAPSLLFAALLWYAVGRWIDQQWAEPRAAQSKLVWGLLLAFTLICAAGAFVNSTSAYLVWGVIVWLGVGCGVVLSALYRKFVPRAA
jgi:hypothetical protein